MDIISKRGLIKILEDGKFEIIKEESKDLAERCCFCALEALTGVEKGILKVVVETNEPSTARVYNTETKRWEDKPCTTKYVVYECSIGQDECPFLRLYIDLRYHQNLKHTW